MFALRDTPDEESVGETPVAASSDSTLKQPAIEPDRQTPVVAPVPDEPVEDVVGAESVLLDSDDSRWNDRDASDTGPFIDADDDSGDYASGPVSDVGEFLDPDAG